MTLMRLHDSEMERWRMTSVHALQDARLKQNLELRSRVLRRLRSYMDDEGFVEVDTPVLRYHEDPTDNPVFTTFGPGGWPRLHLRTCPEEYTRRAACVFGRVFEVAKSFRNERYFPSRDGCLHLPEFTIVEMHEVDTPLDAAMGRLESTLKTIAEEVGCTERCLGRNIDFKTPFRRVRVLDALLESGAQEAVEFAQRHRESTSSYVPGEDVALHRLLDIHVKPRLIQPTFLMFFPCSADQISCCSVGNEAQRAELDCGGIEIGEVAELQPDSEKLAHHVSCAIHDRHGLGAVDELADSDYIAEVRLLDRSVSVAGFGLERLLMILCGVDDIREVTWYPGNTIKRR